jgi:hypothetical protein
MIKDEAHGKCLVDCPGLLEVRVDSCTDWLVDPCGVNLRGVGEVGICGGRVVFSGEMCLCGALSRIARLGVGFG